MLIKNKEGQDCDILLHDVHGEYTQCLNDIPLYGPEGVTDFVRCEEIWDSYALEFTMDDLGIEDAETKVEGAFKALFGNTLDELIDGLDVPYTIWKIHGTHAGLNRAFEALRSSLMPELCHYELEGQRHEYWQPSGDDTIYDYWPNTMDMLWDFAQNLDTISADDSHKKQVWAIMDKMREVDDKWNDLLPGGENAFEWDAAKRWGYQA